MRGVVLEQFSSGDYDKIPIKNKRGVFEVIIDKEDVELITANLRLFLPNKLQICKPGMKLTSRGIRVTMNTEYLSRVIAAKYYSGNIKEMIVLHRDGNALNLSKSNLTLIDSRLFRTLESKKLVGVSKKWNYFSYRRDNKEIGRFITKTACALHREKAILEDNLKLKRNFDNMTLDECKEDLKLLYL